MFGLAFSEILLIVLIAFLVFGPEKFPEALRQFFKIINTIRQSITRVQDEVMDIGRDVKEDIMSPVRQLEEGIKPYDVFEDINREKEEIEQSIQEGVEQAVQSDEEPSEDWEEHDENETDIDSHSEESSSEKEDRV